MENFFNNMDLPSLSQDLRNNLDAPITQEEISAAISSMQSGKPPGPDGFPQDFLKKFSTDLTPFLCSVFSDSLNSGALPPSLPPSFNQACITLLHKKYKGPLDCTSYRPISLLNTDVKVLAKILTHSLEVILPSVISRDQTGFIKRRHLFYVICWLFNILYSSEHADSECLTSMDAEKAFDRVEWSYFFFKSWKIWIWPCIFILDQSIVQMSFFLGSDQ